MAEGWSQPYLRYHGSEFLCAVQLLFHRSLCSTDRLFLYHGMDASLRRAFLPLPRSSSCQPAVSGSDEVDIWSTGFTTVTTAAGMRKRWSIKQKAIDFSTTRYRSVHFRQFFGACLQSKRSRGWEQGESSATWKPPAMHSTEYGWSRTEDGIPRRR